ncbi:MAG: cell division ATP-binding protein FtsE [Oscillospiraceae bacterium]|nr:cell division ATP-binding protein FtsE [Oscillospiraceae bacterium]
MVQFENVTKTYPNGTQALKGISFKIEDGEFVFLVGPSGSGKSTIIRLMNAELRPTSGDVIINDFSVKKLKSRKVPYLRRTLGVIFQDFRLISDKSVYSNVAFAMRALGVKRKFIKPRVEYVLGLVGLENHAKRLPDQISGGEQQRVAIARALVNNPNLIIADEPTGNLDPARSMEIMELLEHINSMGTTVVVVTHEKGLVNHFNKRVIAIDDGVVISDGTGGYYEKNRRPAPAKTDAEYDGYEEYEKNSDKTGEAPDAREIPPAAARETSHKEVPEAQETVAEPQAPAEDSAPAAAPSIPVSSPVTMDDDLFASIEHALADIPELNIHESSSQLSPETGKKRVPTFETGEITSGLISQEEALEAILSSEREGRQ